MPKLLSAILALITLIFCALTILLGAAVVFVWLEYGFNLALQYPVGYIWFDMNLSSMDFVQSLILHHLPPEVWSPGITTIMDQPLLKVFLISLAISVGAYILSPFRRKGHLPETR